MIGGLRKMLDDLRVHVRIQRRARHDFLEQIRVNAAGAGERKKDSAGTQ